MEFLTTIDLAIPVGTEPAVVDDAELRQAQRERELADAGHLLRLWMPASPPRGSRTFGLWEARDADQLRAVLASLPMDRWTTVEARAVPGHTGDVELDALTGSPER